MKKNSISIFYRDISYDYFNKKKLKITLGLLEQKADWIMSDTKVLFSNIFEFHLLCSLFSLQWSLDILVLGLVFFIFPLVIFIFIIVSPGSFIHFDFLTDCVFFLTVFPMLKGVEMVICFTVSYEGSPGAFGDVLKMDCRTAKELFFTHDAKTLNSDFFIFTLLIMKICRYTTAFSFFSLIS